MAINLPAGNQNPQIPEELLFWSNIDLHQQLVYGSAGVGVGTYTFTRNTLFVLKSKF